MVEEGESEYLGVLKTRKLLFFRDGQNAENGKIAVNWNVSGTRGIRLSERFSVEELISRASRLHSQVIIIQQSLHSSQNPASGQWLAFDQILNGWRQVRDTNKDHSRNREGMNGLFCIRAVSISFLNSLLNPTIA